MLPLLTATTLLSYSTFLFDLDGVLQNGHRNVIPNAPDIVNFLYKNKKEVIFVSNNDWETPEKRVHSFNAMGFTEVQPLDIVIPILVAKDYFRDNGYANTTMFVLAPENVKSTLKNELGIKLIEDKQRVISTWNFTELNEDLKVKPSAVIMDSFLTYTNENLAKAVNYLRDPKVQFFTLSGDDRFKGQHGLLIPDVGSFKFIVENVAGRKATTLGKPSSALNSYLKLNKGVGGKKAIMFGDNLNTDMIMANQMGIDSCLMLTGVHGLNDVLEAQKHEENLKIPTFTGNFTLLAHGLGL